MGDDDAAQAVGESAEDERDDERRTQADSLYDSTVDDAGESADAERERLAYDCGRFAPRRARCFDDFDHVAARVEDAAVQATQDGADDEKARTLRFFCLFGVFRRVDERFGFGVRRLHGSPDGSLVPEAPLARFSTERGRS